MKIGYVRVSTLDQNPARQFEKMESFGVDKIFAEKISGKNTNRPQFKEMLTFAREGDIIYVESFSRLSRSTRDLLETMHTLSERGVSVVSDKEKIDTTTPQGKLVMTVFAAIYQFERETTLQRMQEGLEIAKREGRIKGRPKSGIPEEFKTFAKAWASGEMRLKDAIAESGVSEPTFFRRCRELGIKKCEVAQS